MNTKQCKGILCNGKQQNLLLFNKDLSRKNGIQAYCKLCCSEYSKLYRLRNKNKLAKNKHKYYVNNKDKSIAYNKKYWADNKKQLSEKSKKYREENSEKLREASANYYQKKQRTDKQTSKKISQDK